MDNITIKMHIFTKELYIRHPRRSIVTTPYYKIVESARIALTHLSFPSNCSDDSNRNPEIVLADDTLCVIKFVAQTLIETRGKRPSWKFRAKQQHHCPKKRTAILIQWHNYLVSARTSAVPLMRVIAERKNS